MSVKQVDERGRKEYFESKSEKYGCKVAINMLLPSIAITFTLALYQNPTMTMPVDKWKSGKCLQKE